MPEQVQTFWRRDNYYEVTRFSEEKGSGIAIQRILMSSSDPTAVIIRLRHAGAWTFSVSEGTNWKEGAGFTVWRETASYSIPKQVYDTIMSLVIDAAKGGAAGAAEAIDRIVAELHVSL